MGKRGDLSTQSSTTSNLILSKAALLLVLAAEALDLGVPVTEKTLEVHLTDVALLDDGLELVADPGYTVSKCALSLDASFHEDIVGGRNECGQTYASSRSTSIFSLRGFPLALMQS